MMVKIMNSTFFEERNGHKYACVVLIDTNDELLIQKTDIFTGEVRYDRFRPNPNIEKNHMHEFNDTNTYGAHFENTPQSIKRKLKNNDGGNKDGRV